MLKEFKVEKYSEENSRGVRIHYKGCVIGEVRAEAEKDKTIVYYFLNGKLNKDNNYSSIPNKGPDHLHARDVTLCIKEHKKYIIRKAIEKHALEILTDRLLEENNTP